MIDPLHARLGEHVGSPYRRTTDAINRALALAFCDDMERFKAGALPAPPVPPSFLFERPPLPAVDRPAPAGPPPGRDVAPLPGDRPAPTARAAGRDAPRAGVLIRCAVTLVVILLLGCGPEGDSASHFLAACVGATVLVERGQAGTEPADESCAVVAEDGVCSDCVSDYPEACEGIGGEFGRRCAR